MLHTPEFLAARHAAMLQQRGFEGVDATDPSGPSGHAYGLRVSSRLTSDYRKRLRRGSVDVTPQEVIHSRASQREELGIDGTTRLRGCLPMPRATQDVDVMVPYSEKELATNAIAARWPTLTKHTLSQVVRFLDPTDIDADGKPKPVIDIMFPWSPFQHSILKDYVIEDAETRSRYPTVEAAIVSKYAALVSPHRAWDKKQQDAVDLRRIIRANHGSISRDTIKLLGDQVWEHGGEELLNFLALALEDKPFPV